MPFETSHSGSDGEFDDVASAFSGLALCFADSLSTDWIMGETGNTGKKKFLPRVMDWIDEDVGGLQGGSPSFAAQCKELCMSDFGPGLSTDSGLVSGSGLDVAQGVDRLGKNSSGKMQEIESKSFNCSDTTEGVKITEKEGGLHETIHDSKENVAADDTTSVNEGICIDKKSADTMSIPVTEGISFDDDSERVLVSSESSESQTTQFLVKGMDVQLIKAAKSWVGNTKETKTEVHLWCDDSLEKICWVNRDNPDRHGSHFHTFKRNWTPTKGASVPLSGKDASLVIKLDEKEPRRLAIQIDEQDRYLFETANSELAKKWCNGLNEARKNVTSNSTNEDANEEEGKSDFFFGVNIDKVDWPAVHSKTLSMSVSVGTDRYVFGEHRINSETSAKCRFVYNEGSSSPVQTTLVICVWDSPQGENNGKAGKVEVILEPMMRFLQNTESTKSKTTTVKLEALESNGGSSMDNSQRFLGAQLTLTFSVIDEAASSDELSAFTTPCIHTDDHTSTVDHLLAATLLQLRRELSVAMGTPDFRFPIVAKGASFDGNAIPLYLKGVLPSVLQENDDVDILNTINPMQSRSDPSRMKSKIGYKQVRVSVNK